MGRVLGLRRNAQSFLADSISFRRLKPAQNSNALHYDFVMADTALGNKNFSSLL